MTGPPASHYPVSLVVDGRSCLVVGGGAVATKKVAELLRCGADVTVVAPDAAVDIEKLAGDGALHLARRPYLAGEAGRYRLVVAATGNRDVDREVAADAETAGVWVNCADDPRYCSFLLPSVHRQGDVSVAVSTGGASPALAVWLRRRLAGAIGPSVATLATLLSEARQRLRAQGRATTSVDWSEVLDGPLPDLVAEGRNEEARALLRHLTD